MSKVVKKVTIGIVLFVGIFALLIAWAGHARKQTAHQSCIGNLKSIEGAKATWALDHGKSDDDVPAWTDLFGRGRPLTQEPKCPQGGTYTIGRTRDLPRCTFPGHNLE